MRYIDDMDKKEIKSDMGEFLNIPTGAKPTDEEFVIFKKKIAPLINLDLSNYKNTQMERRILSLMFRNGIKTLGEYFNILKTDKAALEEFLNMLTINVTEFFRNNDKFEELEKKYIPELLKKDGRLKIWSAGCSIGAEIYSIAMILDKLDALNKCELVASDFDDTIIKKAKSGIYSKLEVGTIKKGYEQYFKPSGADKYQIDTKLTSKVRFTKADLLNSRFENGFNLILCRNVVIYFTEEAKDQLYKKFYDSLTPGGILFIGCTERINTYREIGFNLASSFFYQK